jgi:hypothetical protein
MHISFRLPYSVVIHIITTVTKVAWLIPQTGRVQINEIENANETTLVKVQLNCP